MAESKPIYGSDGEWKATLYEGNLFDTMGEWIAWLDGNDVYLLDGEYVGYISQDGRLLRKRVLSHHKRRRPPTKRPQFQAPASVPLPPMFAELSYDIIDVFEEIPDTFVMISDLRPDAGEESSTLTRLVDVNPQLAAEQRLQKIKLEMLEEMTSGIIYSYGVTGPPVPIEAMAAGQRPEKASDVEKEFPFERVHLAEQLVKRLGRSRWAAERGYCDAQGFSTAQVAYAARALLLPRQWIIKTPEELRHPQALAQQYLVPEETATLRLHDLAI